MDASFLRYYNNELQHIREMGGEFAKLHPKIAGRLGLESFECADPYVERLLEGFAFLTARLQLKIDKEFPKFTQHLLEIIYPHYLYPTPSQTVARFNVDLSEGSLSEGFLIPKNSSLRGQIGKGEQTACEFRTVRDLRLWPIKLTHLKYLPSLGDISATEIRIPRHTKAALRLSLEATAGLNFEELDLEELSLYIRGSGDIPLKLFEQLHANCTGVVVRWQQNKQTHSHYISSKQLSIPGFDAEQSLFSCKRSSFQGYRLLQEYFSFPEAFHFINIKGMQSAIHSCAENRLDLIFCLNRSDTSLLKSLTVDNFNLSCTPAINLFHKTCDRIHIDNRSSELHIIPDRTRPMDFEVHSIEKVQGFGSDLSQGREFKPFYWSNDRVSGFEEKAYYTQRRHPRELSQKQKREGPRSSYVGSELFITPVDALEAPYPDDLKQLNIEALCSNRDLPLQMPIGHGASDFSLTLSAPVESIRCVAGPTSPREAIAEGETSWRLISQLTPNYLSIIDVSGGNNPGALRQLLEIYIDTNNASLRKQIDGITAVTSSQIIRRIPIPGPITAGRGIQIDITLDETHFEGTGIFLLGCVLEDFFARYVSINSFTETRLFSVQRGEVMRWPLRLGRRQTI